MKTRDHPHVLRDDPHVLRAEIWLQELQIGDPSALIGSRALYKGRLGRGDGCPQLPPHSGKARRTAEQADIKGPKIEHF